MKRTIYFIAASLTLVLTALTGCTDVNKETAYDGQLHSLVVTAAYPAEYASFARAGVTVKVEDINRGNSYQAPTDADGVARFSLTSGLYRVGISDRDGQDVFNGVADLVKLTPATLLADGTLPLSVPLTHSKAGSIVIKEIYSGGCSRAPLQGTYQFDQYIILHNNDSQTQYLDSLCLGTYAPGNAFANNDWAKDNVLPDFAPIYGAIWQFGGTGQSHPLAPGEDAVIAIGGAINHETSFPLSVNLNKPGYYVCYNSVLFNSSSYHPAPGDQIQTDHYLNVVVKIGIANAYSLSITSPAVALFRAQGQTIQDFVNTTGNIVLEPSSGAKVPLDWIVDGVEVFSGTSSNNKKRIQAGIDAGYVTLDVTYMGHVVARKVDEDATAEAGYEVLEDTNNSSSDFEKRDVQTLHE
ncbi:MAG: DUF4876 domain-containing protein [Mediterranea sp.]|jgi:hypothetical protein|nr:DUF4876 domain-containing protein [Mediterranea sp.]